MTLVNLFSAIYHNDEKQLRSILNNHPEFINMVFQEPQKFTHTLTKELYALCEEDRKVDDPNYKEEMALHFAARLGRKEICRILIEEFNADVNKINVYGHNAFMSATSVETNENFDTALMILNNPELNLKHTNAGKYDLLGQLLRSLQHFHSSKDLSIQKAQEVIDALLDKKDKNNNQAFDLNKPQGKSGESAFLLACGAHSWIVVIYLISRGADYSAKNNYLHYERDMYSYFTGNQYFPPKAKEEVLGLLEGVIKSTGNAYGPYKRPAHLYVDFNGEPMKFDSKRFG